MGSWFSKNSECEGDLIEIFRPGYQHWALYVGGGYVVHLAPPSEYPGAGFSSIGSVMCTRAVVKKELLCDVVGGCDYRVNNYLDNVYTPLPISTIIRSAKKMIGEELEYHVLNKNCEHFVTKLRYGKAHSQQAENFKIGALLTGALGVSSAIGFPVGRPQFQKQ